MIVEWSSGCACYHVDHAKWDGSSMYLGVGQHRAPKGTGIAPVWSLKHNTCAFHQPTHCMQSDLTDCWQIFDASNTWLACHKVKAESDMKALRLVLWQNSELWIAFNSMQVASDSIMQNHLPLAMVLQCNATHSCSYVTNKVAKLSCQPSPCGMQVKCERIRICQQCVRFGRWFCSDMQCYGMAMRCVDPDL